MKKALLILALMFPGFAFAQSDYHAVWDIPNKITLGNTVFTELRLDINEGTRYLTINGILSTGTTARPTTGTCFITTSGIIHCSMTIDFLVMSVVLAPDQKGSITLAFANSPDITESLVFRSVE